MRRRTLTVAGILALGSIAVCTMAIQISPVEFEVTLGAGSSADSTFTVHNDESDPLDVSIQLCDWNRDVSGANRFCDEAGSVARSASGWISLSPKQFQLAPQKSQDVHFTISVPSAQSDGSPLDGSYWTAMMVELTPANTPSGNSGTQIVVMRRFGLKVIASIAGTGKMLGQVSDLERHGLNPLTISFEFQNRGTLNLNQVKGRFEIRDTSGETIDSQVVGPFPVLPGATRRVELSTKDSLPPGKYLLLAIIDYGGENPVGAQLVLSVPQLNLAPIGGSKTPPRDLDRDGFYEDVNGDGQLTIEDPTLLGLNLDSPAVQENWPAFDFNNDGIVNFDDVIALKGMVSGSNGS